MKKPVIRKADANAEILTDERCFITEFSNLPDDPAVSISRARVAPGTTTAWHRLDGITERYLITGGRARVEIGGHEPTDIEAGRS